MVFVLGHVPAELRMLLQVLMLLKAVLASHWVERLFGLMFGYEGSLEEAQPPPPESRLVVLLMEEGAA